MQRHDWREPKLPSVWESLCNFKRQPPTLLPPSSSIVSKYFNNPIHKTISGIKLYWSAGHCKTVKKEDGPPNFKDFVEANFLIGDPTVIHILQLSKDVINDGLDFDNLLVSFDYRTSYRIFMGTLLLISSLITSSWIQTSFSFRRNVAAFG